MENELIEPPVDNRTKVRCVHTKMVPLSEIKEHPKNPNRHGREQVEILANAIRSTGWRTAIGVSTLSGYIIRGHGRFRAAQALGLKEVPVDYQFYDNEAQELADLLGDNKIADLSEIDYEGVSKLLHEIPEDQLFMTGFRDFEITPLMAAEWIKPALCEVPEFTAGFKFSCSEEENQTVRKAIKLVQSKSSEDLTDGKCLEMMATWYLAGVITQEQKLSQEAGPAPKAAKVKKEVIASSDKPANILINEIAPHEDTKTVVFKVKYVADTKLSDTDVTVIRSEDDEAARYYTIDATIIATARAAIMDKAPYKVKAVLDTSGTNAWIKSLEKSDVQ